MNGSEMPRHSRTAVDGLPPFVTGQRVKITGGPLRDLRGTIEGSCDGERVLINAGEDLPGICIRISPNLLEALDS